MAMSDNAKGAALMAGAMLAYASNDAFVKAAARAVPMHEVVVLRGVVASLMMAGLILFGRGMRAGIPRRDWPLVLVRTATEIGFTIFFLRALAAMPLANLHAVMQALPLTVALAAALFLREPLGWRRLTAILVGFAGVMLILRPGSTGFDAHTLNGLAAVGFITARDLVARRFSPAVPTLPVALITGLAVTLWFAVAGGQGAWMAPGPRDGGLILAAALAVLVGYVLSIAAMRVGEIGFVSPFRYTSLLAALGLGWLLFGDWPDALTFAGAGIVVATGLFTLYREGVLARAAGALPPARPTAR